MSALTISAKTLERALSDALEKRVSALDVEGLTLLNAGRAAKMLGLSQKNFRLLACDHFDMGGERRTRWSLRELRELIEARRVKVAKRAPSGATISINP